MGGSCGSKDATAPSGGSASSCGGAAPGGDDPFAWFGNMIPNCLAYAKEAKAGGRPVVGILCEYAPREILLAAGAVPICLCGGSAETLPAAEETLPASLCPLIKSTFGYHALGSNPFLEMADLIVGETTCDGKKKMFELMGRTRPMHVLELPQKPDDPDALAHWLRELWKFRTEVERRFEVAVTDEALREAIRTMNRERALRRDLAAFMREDAPPLTGLELLRLKSSIGGVPCGLVRYEQAIEALRARPRCPSMAERTRVLLTGVPLAHGAERVMEILEARGGLVVAQENCTGLKPILEDVDAEADDPMAALAGKYLRLPCSVMTPNDRRMETLRTLAEAYRPDCVVDLTWQGCLTYEVESRQAREAAEALGLPFLQIVTDYAPADSERIGVRVEALYETARAGASRAASPAPSCGSEAAAQSPRDPR